MFDKPFAIKFLLLKFWKIAPFEISPQKGYGLFFCKKSVHIIYKLLLKIFFLWNSWTPFTIPAKFIKFTIENIKSTMIGISFFLYFDSYSSNCRFFKREKLYYFTITRLTLIYSSSMFQKCYILLYFLKTHRMNNPRDDVNSREKRKVISSFFWIIKYYGQRFSL